MRLQTQPAADVTVTITAGTNLEIDDNNDNDFGTTETLTFTGGATGNWNTAQTVRVKALADDNLDDETPALTHDIASTLDIAYNFLDDVTLTVTIEDNDDPSIILKYNDVATTTLALIEGAAADEYTVELSNQPSANVTVLVTSAGDVTIDGPDGPTAFTTTETLTFTPGSYGPQIIRAQAAADPDLSDDDTTITHAASDAGADASGYAGVSKDLDVTETDATTPTIVLTDSDGNSLTTLAVTERTTGIDVTYRVALSNQPLDTVTVTITTSDNDAATIATDGSTFSGSETLEFTTGNWNETQDVTVRAPHDNDDDNESVTITHDPDGAGSGYETIASQDLTVSVDDDDDPAIALYHATDLTATTTLTVTEEATATYRVRLASQPTQSVTVTITPSAGLQVDDGGGTFANSGTLTFPAADWDVLQTVTVQAAEDVDLTDTTITIAHSTDSTDTDYARAAGLSATLTVTVEDNDAAAIILKRNNVATTTLALIEGAAADEYTVELSNQPSANVTVLVTSAGDVTIDGPDGPTAFTTTETLTFTPGSYGPQIIRAQAAADPDLSDDDTTITHAASDAGADASGYAGVSKDLDVTETDSTIPTIVLTDSDGNSLTALDVTERATGSNVTYNVGLSNPPLAAVTVVITSGDADAVQIDDGGTFGTSRTLTFAIGATTAQTVTVRAPHDNDDDNESVTITHNPDGAGSGGYETIASQELTVSVDDDDDPPSCCTTPPTTLPLPP